MDPGELGMRVGGENAESAAMDTAMGLTAAAIPLCRTVSVARHRCAWMTP